MKFSLKSFFDLMFMKNLSPLIICFLIAFTACGGGGGDDNGGAGAGGTPPYIITFEGTSTFKVTQGSNEVALITKVTIQDAINDALDAIKSDAGGEDCAIQFGNGSTLDIDANSVIFGGSGWGTSTITLLGDITSSNSSTSSGTIVLLNGASIISKANIGNQMNGCAIYNDGTGMISISAGTVSATTGYAVNNASTGTVNVNGGTVESTGSTGRAIHNNSTGEVNISAGTVSAEGTVASSYAVYNASTGKISVSQDPGKTTLVTSKGTTIYLSGTDYSLAIRLVISGGTVRNTNTASGYAIHNASSGEVNISSGTVSAEVITIFISNTGTGGKLNISGGTVLAKSSRAIQSNSSNHIGQITISQAPEKTTLVTSANQDANSGTIFLNSYDGGATTVRLEINGGTVQNTSTTGTGNAVYNTNSPSVVSITAPPAIIIGAKVNCP